LTAEEGGGLRALGKEEGAGLWRWEQCVDC
jgi:hypothetical protein